MKRSYFLSLLALSVLFGCQKGDEQLSQSVNVRKSSTHFAFWNGYNFFTAYTPHHNAVFNLYPSPEPWEQDLNELEYYTAYGITQMVDNHSLGMPMVNDINLELSLNNGIIFAESFFDKYPIYLSVMDSYVNIYGVTSLKY